MLPSVLYVIPVVLSVTSAAIVLSANVFVTSTFTFDVASSSIAIVMSFAVNAEFAKYLSVTSNTTVTFLVLWSIVVFAYSYVYSGLMKSANIVPAVFLFTSSSPNVTSIHVPVSSISIILWFPYTSVSTSSVYVLVSWPLPAIFSFIFPLHSLYGIPVCLIVSSKFDNTIVWVISVLPVASFVVISGCVLESGSTVIIGCVVLVTFTPSINTVMSSADSVLVTSLA